MVKGNPLPQPSPNAAWYRAQAFANLAGVTVRTLHHYDRLGLLKPTRSSRGYRLYQAIDLERLEQIIALKFLGLPLSDIRRLLDGKPSSLQEELDRQREALVDKRKLLDRALAAIQDAHLAIQEGIPATALLRRIIEAIDMDNDKHWIMKYYSPAAQAKIAERAAASTLEMQAQIAEEWKRYYHDLYALNEHQNDPDGAKAADLAKRHGDLIAAFTGNDPEIEAGLKALYRDRKHWPAEMKHLMSEYELPT